MSFDLNKTLFNINQHNFTRQNFLEALKFHQLYDHWCDIIQAGEHLTELAKTKNLQVDTAELNELGNKFRYEQKLLTINEFHNWLNLFDLSISDFESYLLKKYWQNRLDTETPAENSSTREIPAQKLFAELHFSGSFKALLFSWQKRLLAWCDTNKTPFPGNDLLEENFRLYQEKVSMYFDLENWFSAQKNELILYQYEISTSKDFNESTKIISELSKELPQQLKTVIPVLKEGEIFSLESNAGDQIYGKFLNKKLPDIKDPDIISELRSEFLNEVWMTLEVKYVR